jgi:branched-chain amino acid transport system substrate-binding protein
MSQWDSIIVSRAVGFLGSAMLVAGTASCSLIVDTSVSDSLANGCTKTAECTSRLGDYHICKRAPGAPSGTCANLFSANCTRVSGDYKNDDAFIFGSVLPSTGPDTSTGKACENAIILAIEDLRQTANGLPALAGEGKRPLVLVACSDQSDKEVGMAGATHLVEEVGVSAIIGAQWSGVTTAIATTVTAKRDVLLLSPSATAVAITGLEDNGLLWRTSPSDVFQATALVKYFSMVEKAVVAGRPGAKVKAAMVFQGGDYGLGISEKITDKQTTGGLQLNGFPANDPSNSEHFKTFNYGDPSESEPLTTDRVVTNLIQFAPDIVLLLGTNEGVTQVLKPVEQQWGISHPDVPGPRWILGDGGEIKELWDFIAGNDGLRRRTTGTVPGTNNPLFQSFKQSTTRRASTTEPTRRHWGRPAPMTASTCSPTRPSRSGRSR